MMDALLSTSSTAKTKNEFISKAHEARQARELARRQEKAATTIQAHLRAHHIRKQLRKETFVQLDEIVKISKPPDANELQTVIQRVLFLCHRQRDRNVLVQLLQYISKISHVQYGKEQGGTSDTPMEVDTVDLSGEYMDSTDKWNGNLFDVILESVSKKEQTLDAWIDLLVRIIDLCLEFSLEIEEVKSDCSKSSLQNVVDYLNIINTFTSQETKLISDCDENYIALKRKITDEVSTRTLSRTRSVFHSLSKYISKIINRPLNDLKVSILNNYIHLSIRLIKPEKLINEKNLNSMITSGRCKDSTDILLTLLSIPALVYHLEKCSPSSAGTLNQASLFKLILRLLSNDQTLNNLTSTPSLCLLANLIHCASLNEEIVANDIVPFVVLVTKLLESCKKNMKQMIKSTEVGQQKNPRPKGHETSTDESYNHILGWLAREQAPTIDRDTSKLIKLQLSHLWSIKFLRILFSELIKYEENQAVHKAPSSGASLSTKQKTLSPKRSNCDSDNNTTIQTHCDNQYIGSSALAPFSMIKRVVERAAITMTKTIGSSYSKTTGSHYGGSGSSKLVSEEGTRIALVCFMLHTALQTLKIIKQDILTGLCLHDYILKNLWNFISSLGPHNGLKAFLDHLAIHTKTSAPEFHILTLFCECASHLISILDDSELYEQQRPFSLDELVTISSFLNYFVFRVITNQLVACGTNDTNNMDAILSTTHKLLTDLYKRDCRRRFAPQDHWLIKEVKMSLFLKDLETGKPVAKAILKLLPHIMPHKERVLIFRRLVAKDKAQYCSGFSTFITIHRSRIVEDGYQQLARLPPNALKGLIRVKFINDYGLDEAGIDQDGVFKEFLEDTIKRVFDPALNLFCSTSEQRLYPSPTSRLHEDHLSLFNFVGKMLGKAIYEGIVVDVPFASFFLSRVLGQPQSPLYSPIDELPSLDPELYKSLTYIKHYEGDVGELDLTFSIDQDFMGKIETYELEAGGKHIPVTRESRVRYIHSVANFRMKTQIEQQTEAFVRGFKSIIDLEWLSIFSTAEFQRLISGDESPIDLQDLRRHTKYFGGFHSGHRVICWLWDILERDFSAEEHRLFLKFITSCSKPPLLGFANLEPPFSIRCVEVSDDQDLGDTVGSVVRGFLAIRRSDPVDRLPTSSTCFNLLKLPNYQRRSTLREKLRYAIRSSTGFELS